MVRQQEISKGSYVWVHDDENCFLPAKILAEKSPKVNGSAVVELIQAYETKNENTKNKSSQEELEEKSNEIKVVPLGNLSIMNEQSLETVFDMSKLRDLNEASILHNMRQSYASNTVYLGIGSILLSVNPYQLLPIYTPEIMDKYSKGVWKLRTHPHVYGVAESAFQGLIQNQANQACLVSGESGAGKTETVKLFMQYLAEQTGVNDMGEQIESGVSLQQRILQCNPLMESFGNATTIRNKNSSRFGKWTQINFDKKRGTIISAEIINYLLEKSRVVTQAKQERNYHIFYELLAGAKLDSNLQHKLHFPKSSQISFQYLNEGEALHVEGINDQAGWDELCRAMAAFDLQHEMDHIFSVLAAILHLGNVNFEKDTSEKSRETCFIPLESEGSLQNASKLLGVDAANLGTALRKRVLRTINKESIYRDHNSKQAGESRDVLAKTIYGRMFDWLVSKINQCLSNSKSPLSDFDEVTFIGILDIFGFETLSVNSFEQLCVNYCNEKLQLYFNDHVFKLEQEQYAQEGISVSNIGYEDNSSRLELMEGKRGIFSMINDEIKIPKGSDESLLKKMFEKFKGNDFLSSKGPLIKNVFVVHHYAGPVDYEISGFVKKNKDLMYNDLEDLLSGSSFKFVSELFDSSFMSNTERRASIDGNLGSNRRQSFQAPSSPGGNSPTSSPRGSFTGGRDRGLSTISNFDEARKGNSKSLGIQFKDQLTNLLDLLDCTEPHFIRCIKPNSSASKNEFQPKMVLEQLRYSGVLEACKIRKNGYPVRKTFEEFNMRFAGPILQTDASSLSPTEACVKLQKLKVRDTVDGKKGNAEEADICVLAEGEWVVGKSIVFFKEQAMERLQEARVNVLNSKVVMIQAFFRGVTQRKMYKFYSKILSDLDTAVKHRKIENLETALEMAGELPHEGTHLKQVQEAEKLRRKFGEESKLVSLLQTAISDRNMNALMAHMHAAVQMGLDPRDYADVLMKADDLIRAVEAEEAAKEELSKAIKSKKLKQIIKAIEKAEAVNLPFTCVQLSQAMALRKRLEAVEKTAKELDQAVAKKNMSEIEKLLEKMSMLNQLNHPSVTKAKKVAQIAKVKESEGRKKKILETFRLVHQGIREKNIETLHLVRTRAAELGLEDKQLIKQAFITCEALEKEVQLVEKLKAVLDGIEIKQSSASGVEEKDLTALHNAIEIAEKGCTELESDDDKKIIVSDENSGGIKVCESIFTMLEDARSLESKVNEQIELQQELSIALQGSETKSKLDGDSVDIPLLKSLLDRAGAIGCKTAEMEKAAEIVRSSESRLSVEVDLFDFLNDNESVAPGEREHGSVRGSVRGSVTSALDMKSKYRKASQKQFSFERYYLIRSDAEYAKGHMQKKNLIERKLCYQNFAIPRSLISLDKRTSKMAVNLHTNLLGYCGDLVMGFPATLVERNLATIVEKRYLVDEQYLQIMKHLTHNPNKQSIGRAWQFFCMVTACVLPSVEFEDYVINFLLKHIHLSGLVGVYANYALQSLVNKLKDPEQIIEIPNVDQIKDYQTRMPSVVTVMLIDGNPVAREIPISPDMDMEDLMDDVMDFLQMPTSRKNMFGLYLQRRRFGNYESSESIKSAEEDEERAAAFPMVLGVRDYIGDVVMGFYAKKKETREEMEVDVSHTKDSKILAAAGPSSAITLYLKRKFYYDNESLEPHKDAKYFLYERLGYIQAFHEYKNGNWPVKEEQTCIQLAALALAEHTISQGGGNQMVEITQFVTPFWLDQCDYSVQEWSKRILPLAKPEVALGDVRVIQSKFLKLIRKENLYGTSSFTVSQFKKDSAESYKTKGKKSLQPKKKKSLANKMGFVKNKKRSSMFSSKSQGNVLAQNMGTMTGKDSEKVELILKMNSKGIYLCTDTLEREVKEYVPLSQISRVACNMTQLMIYIANSKAKGDEVLKMKVNTIHAEYIGTYIMDYKYLNEVLKQVRYSNRRGRGGTRTA